MEAWEQVPCRQSKTGSLQESLFKFVSTAAKLRALSDDYFKGETCLNNCSFYLNL